MKTLETMTPDERSLLLFLETRAVDFQGRVNSRHMNEADLATAKKWNEEGFVEFGRICHADCTGDGGNWCHLSDEAHALAAAERKARAVRTWERKRYLTTAEKRPKP